MPTDTTILTKVQRETMQAYRNNQRLIANRGGTRSGKTYSIMMMLIWIAAGRSTPISIDVVSETIPHLNRGTIQDMEDICESLGLLGTNAISINKSQHTYTFSRNGSVVRFFSADSWGKVKGARRDVLFVNEANRIDWETFRQLDVRTKRTIIIDWNPDAEFWYESKGLNIRPDTTEIVSTYKDNPFLTESQIKAIEAYKDDAEWWRVYGLGQVGTTQGLIYTNWEQCLEIPKDARLIARGLDFGFTNDPTAIVSVYMQGGDLWLNEECYSQGLTNDAIADILKALPQPNSFVVADSAEQKSIKEISNYGVRNIEPAVKGADSVRNGIQIVKRYKLHVTQSSLNLIRELRNYRWATNKMTGETLNTPNKSAHFDHALDAVRYVCLNKLAQRRHGTARATIGRQL